MFCHVRHFQGFRLADNLHVWSLSSKISVASVYLTDSTTTLDERDAFIVRIHEVLDSRFDITHATVEVVNEQHEHTVI